MLSARRSDPDATVPSGWDERIRRTRRVSERYGLTFEALLALIVTSNITVWLLTVLIFLPGTGEPFVSGFVYVISTVVSLGLIALGGLVVGNIILPLVRISADGITVDPTRFRDWSLWYRIWQSAKCCCAALVVLLSSILLLLLSSIGLDWILSLSIVSEGFDGEFVGILLMFTMCLPLVALILLAGIGLEVLVRAGQWTVERTWRTIDSSH